MTKIKSITNSIKRRFFARRSIKLVVLLGLSLLVIYLKYHSLPSEIGFNFLKAKRESDGFFDDISEKEWDMMKERVNHISPNTCSGPPNCQFNNDNPASWLQNNFEPDFACRHEKRIGMLGDGGKWICDPHRLNKSTPCLVYSVGSANDFSFEEAVKREIGRHCEIHTFDPADYSEGAKKAGVVYHQWGISGKSNESNGEIFKTMKETIEELGHTGQTIDIFKIDCEGCELDSVKTWVDPTEVKATLRQILVEVHLNGKLDRAQHFMEVMREYNYVISHKEPNMISWFSYKIPCVEYVFVKLNGSFFNPSAQVIVSM